MVHIYSKGPFGRISLFNCRAALEKVPGIAATLQEAMSVAELAPEIVGQLFELCRRIPPSVQPSSNTAS
uniref:Uncharacterized protein n=1 Tax=Oryza rufipogon TaxID=4529 RepID=A0A0E0R1E2_ORYRU